jgi:hypothetical protein
MNEWRILKVKSVTETEPPGNIDITFEDFVGGIQATKEYLKEQGLENLSPGDLVKIKGPKGNRDYDFIGESNIEIKRA